MIYIQPFLLLLKKYKDGPKWNSVSSLKMFMLFSSLIQTFFCRNVFVVAASLNICSFLKNNGISEPMLLFLGLNH